MQLIKSIFFLLVLLLAACSSGGGDSNCNDTLTVELVNNEIQTELLYTSDGITVSGTTLVHDDGNQGNAAADFLRLVLARANHPTYGDTLLMAYSVTNTNPQTSDTFIALYLDIDNNPLTGLDIDSIGADSLILDDHALNDSAPSFAHYHIWSGTAWDAQPTLGTLFSMGSYFEGCTEVIGISIPLSMGLADLYGLPNVSGVMKVIKITNGDPNLVAATVDSTSVFTFNMP